MPLCLVPACGMAHAGFYSPLPGYYVILNDKLIKNLKRNISHLARGAYWVLLPILLFCASALLGQTLPGGDTSAAPDFKLKGVDGKTYSLASFTTEYELLVIVFTCNHCPTAQAYEEKLKSLAADYKDRGSGNFFQRPACDPAR